MLVQPWENVTIKNILWKCQSETFGLNWEQCWVFFLLLLYMRWDAVKFSLLDILNSLHLKTLQTMLSVLYLSAIRLYRECVNTYVFLKMYGWILQQCAHQLMRIPGNRLCTVKKTNKKEKKQTRKRQTIWNKWCNECEKERNERKKIKIKIKN